MTEEERFDLWAVEYRREVKDGTQLLWPSETLIRLLKGNYIPDLVRVFEGKRALDVGFGFGSNLFFLCTLGFRVAGTEVRSEICETAQKRLQSYGYEVDLRVGTNRSLPFPDDSFSLLTSWNVIHYEDNEQHIIEAVSEYRRVLEPGGRLILSTTGPDHMILEQSTSLGNHLYQIGREDDFRKDQVFFYFETPSAIENYFGAFKNLRIGRTHAHLMTAVQDYWVLTGTK